MTNETNRDPIKVDTYRDTDVFYCPVNEQFRATPQGARKARWDTTKKGIEREIDEFLDRVREGRRKDADVTFSGLIRGEYFVGKYKRYNLKETDYARGKSHIFQNSAKSDRLVAVEGGYGSYSRIRVCKAGKTLELAEAVAARDEAIAKYDAEVDRLTTELKLDTTRYGAKADDATKLQQTTAYAITAAAKLQADEKKPEEIAGKTE